MNDALVDDLPLKKNRHFAAGQFDWTCGEESSRWLRHQVDKR